MDDQDASTNLCNLSTNLTTNTLTNMEMPISTIVEVNEITNRKIVKLISIVQTKKSHQVEPITRKGAQEKRKSKD